MDKSEFERLLIASYPDVKLSSNDSGACTWVRVLISERAFAVQITVGEGIGVFEVDRSGPQDFMGHDVVFPELKQVFDFFAE
ncbi:MAG: hypothetical protein V4495_10765 [Pseudomonadota bacterium]